jgi:protein-tyrosine phosphatase
MPEAFSVWVDVAVPPDRAWSVIGDPCGVPKWYQAYVSCEVEGDRRTLRRDDGVELIEHLIDRDDDRRTYSYSVIGGLPLRYHHARFSVDPTPDGCRIVWETTAEHRDPLVNMQERLAGRQQEALDGLKQRLESGELGG